MNPTKGHMNTNHTPGPWRTLANAYVGNWQILSNKTKVATVSKRTIERGAVGDYPDMDLEAAANARLIAAAPELLEACQEAAACMQEWIDADLMVIKAEPLTTLRAAIAKATGDHA